MALQHLRPWWGTCRSWTSRMPHSWVSPTFNKIVHDLKHSLTVWQTRSQARTQLHTFSTLLHALIATWHELSRSTTSNNEIQLSPCAFSNFDWNSAKASLSLRQDLANLGSSRQTHASQYVVRFLMQIRVMGLKIYMAVVAAYFFALKRTSLSL